MRRVIKEKTIIISFILLIQVVGLFAFYTQRDWARNVRSSYVTKIYLPALKAYIFNLSFKENLADVVASITGRERTVKVSAEENFAKSVPVLVYHGIVETADGENVTLDDFRDHMFALKREGYQTVSIYDFLEFAKGRKNLPEKSFLLTFDDGRKDSYYPADPILKALNYRATMFVITGTSLPDNERRSDFYLIPSEIEKMRTSGRWDLQPHAHQSHDNEIISEDGLMGPYFANKLWLISERRLETDEEYKTRVTEDMEEAKQTLVDYGINVVSFTFPFGDFGQNITNYEKADEVLLPIAREMFGLVFYQVWPGKGATYNYPGVDDFLAKRIKVESEWSADNLLSALDSGQNKALPFESTFPRNEGWIDGGGEVYFTREGMVVGADENSTIGYAFLDGAYSWKNYLYRIKGNWVAGTTLSLLANYKDDQNFAACIYSNTGVRVEQRVEGVRTILGEVKRPLDLKGNELDIGMRTAEDRIECSLNGNPIATVLGSSLRQGSVGIQTWDPKLNESEFRGSYVSIREN